MAIVKFGSHVLDLFEHAGNQGERFEPAHTGLDHLAFLAQSADDLHAWPEWLDTQGVPRSAIRQPEGAVTLFDFADPDGIQIEFAFVDLRTTG